MEKPGQRTSQCNTCHRTQQKQVPKVGHKSGDSLVSTQITTAYNLRRFTLSARYPTRSDAGSTRNKARVMPAKLPITFLFGHVKLEPNSRPGHQVLVREEARRDGMMSKVVIVVGEDDFRLVLAVAMQSAGRLPRPPGAQSHLRGGRGRGVAVIRTVSIGESKSAPRMLTGGTVRSRVRSAG